MLILNLFLLDVLDGGSLSTHHAVNLVAEEPRLGLSLVFMKSQGDQTTQLSWMPRDVGHKPNQGLKDTVMSLIANLDG